MTEHQTLHDPVAYCATNARYLVRVSARENQKAITGEGKCPASWIGDGTPDCGPEDECDLSCYDNDGGDCDGPVCDPACDPGQECLPNGEGVQCYVDDCSGEGKCPAEWIGDDTPDCGPEDECDLSCYDNDGGDCDGGGELV